MPGGSAKCSFLVQLIVYSIQDSVRSSNVAKLKQGNRIKVIFIVGFTRSGSTLLEHLLSIAPGTVAVGELAYLWDPNVRNTSFCGCGLEFDHCSFWRRVLAAQECLDFGQDRSPEAAQFWRFFEDLIYKRDGANDQRYRRFLDRLESIYRAVNEQTQGSVIIDSSKKPIFALAASRLPNVDVTLIHLVRDSRGSAFSWTQRKARPELGQNAFMSRLTPYRAALRWIGSNLQASILRMRRGQHIFLRYEDLVARPAVEVNKILYQIGLPPISADRDEVFHAPVSHGVWGNPDRWSSTMHAIKVTKDQRWLTDLSRSDFVTTTLISAPLLKWYGYRLFRSRPG